ncbi:MAG TPA: hypothetical protein VN951_00780 [Pyrinomonadaceae bacterium]|nr:hypothetical protein [Pyrinomonadaceae bacterium]
MPEQESQPIELVDEDVLQQLSRVRLTADAQAVQTDVPDTRALEGEDNLIVAGDQWEKRRDRQLFYARIFLLVALFILVILWVVSIPGLLLIVGYHYRDFNLSDSVIIAYITSTTVSVLGLFHIAARWLFSSKTSG